MSEIHTGAIMQSRIILVLLNILTFAACNSEIQNCKDADWCTFVGIQVCTTSPIVARGCKMKCGIRKVGVHCPKIGRPEHADIRTTSRPPYKVGSLVNFTCDPGYKRTGPSTIICLNTGRWSDSQPYCSARRCRRDLRKVEKGRKCRKQCKRDSDCKGSKNECRCDDWCGKSCFNPREDCPQLLMPTNGYILANGWMYGKTVTYGCNEGFSLSGVSTRRCRSDKKWSGSSPLCIPYGACGQNSATRVRWSDGKVIKGTDAKEGAWPWQALLIHSNDHSFDQIHSPNSVFAGGSIINEDWILSAGHIFIDVFPKNLEAKVWRNTFLIVLGMTKYPKRELEVPDHIQIFTPQSVHIHPNFDRKNFDFDVALIHIGKKMTRGPTNVFVADKSNPSNKIIFSRFVRPVCLPCMKGGPHEVVDVLGNFDKDKCKSSTKRIHSLYADVGSSVMVTGFGVKNDKTGERPVNLQQGLLKILDDLSCADSVRDIKRRNNDVRFTSRMFCAAGGNETARIDSCGGDSGGPVVKRIRDNKTKYWMQLGIVSWGAGECAGEHPGYYTFVPSVMTWIWKTLDDEMRDIKCLRISFPDGNHYNVTSCFEKTVGSNCSITCNDGFEFNNNAATKVWDVSCVLNSSNALDAYWDMESIPDCKQILPCDSKPCDKNAVCKSKDGQYECTCSDGFTGNGETCSKIRPCDSKPCDENAICKNKQNDQHECTCKSGFKGDGGVCTRIEPCDSNPCDKHASCTNKNLQGYECSCNPGYRGNGDTCTRIQPCDSNPCHKYASCKNKNSQEYECACISGYKGNGETCTRIQPCDSKPCHKYSLCKNKNSQEHECACISGYKGNGQTCTRIQPCDSNPCHRYAACRNKNQLEFVCTCKPGYKGNGITCTRIQPCDSNPCHKYATCRNKNVREFECECISGYKGDGRTCTRLQPCDSKPCHKHASCKNINLREYVCTCNERFTGNGKICTKIQPCDSKPCDKNAICENKQNGQYVCRCKAGFTGSGKTCKKIQPCDSNPCDANAVCRNAAGEKYTCTCKASFTGNGITCKKILPCDSNPCHVFATCKNRPGDEHTCTCSVGFIGNGKVCQFSWSGTTITISTTSWSSCSVSCGGGVRRRIRLGKPETSSCNTKSCVPGKWGTWTQWSSCDPKGGLLGLRTRRRSRVCKRRGKCTGTGQSTSLCSADRSHWSPWTTWSACSLGCGAGKRTRTRTCIGTGQCVGNAKDQGTCLGRACSG